MYKKELHDQDNHNGVITHLEPDILECEVQWALESITTNKASGGDGIPVELFQILKDDAVKVLHSTCQQIYTILLPQKAYEYNDNNQIVTITQSDKKVVLRYPIQDIIRQDTMLLHHPEQLLTYRNDSLMLVLEGICIKDTVVTDVRYYGLQLFKKQVK